jgi:DNA-binding CsgD family transcriptional regulator/pimeloyl-ACP methyl ester carboxylesterase
VDRGHITRAFRTIVATGPELAFATSADGTVIAWSGIGSGPALVHLPGVPFSNVEAEWRSPTLRAAYGELARDLRFIQFDGRGTGRSQRDVSDLGLEAMLSDIDAVVDGAGLGRFALLGFYASVPHAIAYAARHPDRVSHLVLFGGSSHGWHPMTGAPIQALLSLIERDWTTFTESAAHAWLGWPAGDEGRLAAEWFRTATTPGTARATLQAAATMDVTGELAKVQCPTLVLHRAGATVVTIEDSQSLSEAIPGGRLLVLEGTSAGLFFEGADVIVPAIVDFVTGRTPSPRAGATAGGRGTAARLTPRELEVLRLVAAGESNGQIAARLNRSINTVERHVANLYRKIDARGRADATAYAIRNGLA